LPNISYPLSLSAVAGAPTVSEVKYPTINTRKKWIRAIML
jgi:hypothetical protein